MHPLLRESNFKRPDYLININKEVNIGDLNYKPPEINVDSLPGRLAASISTGGMEWMSYNFSTDEEALELYSHYFLAEGDCVCTGLGLGVRETWLLNNPKVRSITVIEKNLSIIDFHKKHNPQLANEIKIINDDAINVRMSCDTLLLDHYIYPFSDIVPNAKIVADNIKSQKMWWWPLEDYLLQNAPMGQYYQLYKQLQSTVFPSLAEVTPDQLYLFLSTWMTTLATRERRRLSCG